MVADGERKKKGGLVPKPAEKHSAGCQVRVLFLLLDLHIAGEFAAVLVWGHQGQGVFEL